MNAEDTKRLQTFEARVRQMLLLVDRLRAENKRLGDALAEKEIEIELLNEEVAERKKAYTNLKTARIIDVSDADKAAVRQRINSLIREVDKCINIVKN
ncbi:MAG: hypothetical protein HUK04_00520 [Bacteroidaceae bacterium]|mgnify:FL=1|nr:hypothetical protein [Bacteroidaceae bacterium]